MKFSFVATLLVFGFVLSAKATVTIGFNDAGSSGIATNLANGAGVITDGMRWGIIVDTGNDGFANSGLSYDAYAAGATTSGFLSAGGVQSNDYYLVGGVTVDGTNEGYTDIMGREPGHGTILDDINNGVPFAYSNGMAPGQSFALVWFGTKTGSIYTSGAGDKYGFLTDSTFKLGNDPSQKEFGAPWNVAVIPTFVADKTFAAVAGVPEPSRMLLVGFGALGLMLRRRRSVA